jgi:DNA-binding transcriptional LysR family regulator
MNFIESEFTHIKKISILRQVVSAGSLKKAAVQRKVSVSAISQSITSLEQALNRKFFVRKGHRLVPTQHCLEVLASAEPAFIALENINKAFLPETCIPRIDWLDFGISDCVAADVLPKLVKNLKARLPQIKLKLKVSECSQLTSQVRKGELCMALVASTEAPKAVSAYPILEDRLGLYVSSDSQITKESEISEIGSLSPSTDGHPAYYLRFMRQLRRQLKVSVGCDSYEALYEIAAAGVLPVVLPNRIATKRAGILREVTLDKKSEKMSGQFILFLISQKTCNPAEDDFLLNELRSLM